MHSIVTVLCGMYSLDGNERDRGAANEMNGELMVFHFSPVVVRAQDC